MSTIAKPGVLVTGASTGIGESCALHLRERGFHVFGGVRKVEDGERLCAHAPEDITAVTLDVTRGADIAAAVVSVGEAVGEAGLKGLVNNAGVAVGGAIEYLPVDDLRRQLEVNVTAQVAVTQAFLPLLRKATGRIVNVGSTSGFFAAPLMGPYAASKHAMEAITDSLRLELRPWGMHVAIVQPGMIVTPIWGKAKEDTVASRAAIPEEGHARYGALIARMQELVDEAPDKGSPPIVVARAVAHALTARRPRTRYRMGKDSGVQAFLRYLPDRLRDALIARELGM